MSNLYSFYLEEREGVKTIEEDNGFITYNISDNSVWIRDLYVVPEQRLFKVGSHLADQVASLGRNKGCRVMRCTVSPIALNASNSMAAILSYGFKVTASDTHLIYFEKDL